MPRLRPRRPAARAALWAGVVGTAAMGTGCGDGGRSGTADTAARASAATGAAAGADTAAGARAAAAPADGASASGELAYVSNEEGRTLTVIETGSDRVVATIPVGTRPRGVRVGPGGRQVFVALSGSPRCPPTMPEAECAAKKADRTQDGIAVVDAATRRVLRVLPGGTDPEQFDVSPDGSRLFVANEDAGRASIVDVASGRVVRQVPVGEEPEGVKISPDGRTVYVTSENEHTVTAFDAGTGRVTGRVSVDRRPRDVVVARDGRHYFVSSEVGGTVSMVDARASRVVARLPMPQGALPMGLALSPDESRLYVATGRHGTVEVLDVAARRSVGSVKVGRRPWGIALTGDGGTLYVANGPSHDVSVVDTRTLRVRATLPAGALPWGVAVGAAPAGAPARAR